MAMFRCKCGHHAIPNGLVPPRTCSKCGKSGKKCEWREVIPCKWCRFHSDDPKVRSGCTREPRPIQMHYAFGHMAWPEGCAWGERK